MRCFTVLLGVARFVSASVFVWIAVADVAKLLLRAAEVVISAVFLGSVSVVVSGYLVIVAALVVIGDGVVAFAVDIPISEFVKVSVVTEVGSEVRLLGIDELSVIVDASLVVKCKCVAEASVAIEANIVVGLLVFVKEGVVIVVGAVFAFKVAVYAVVGGIIVVSFPKREEAEVDTTLVVDDLVVDCEAVISSTRDVKGAVVVGLLVFLGFAVVVGTSLLIKNLVVPGTAVLSVGSIVVRFDVLATVPIAVIEPVDTVPVKPPVVVEGTIVVGLLVAIKDTVFVEAVVSSAAFVVESDVIVED